MENNGKSKAERSDKKSKKTITVRSKRQTGCEQYWANYLLINSFLQIKLFIVRKLKMFI